MDIQHPKDRRIFEIMLIVVALGMTAAFVVTGEHGLVALNLFFLPVLLSGYYLGRNSAGILALLCVLSVSIAATAQSTRFAGYNTPTMIGLALTIWAASLGLTALLVGTLCDERGRTVNELQKAYVGVVEVLFKYLQSSDPHSKAQSMRMAEMCQDVARKMRLSRKRVDDIRVASLLRDLESVQISTQFISKAVDSIEKTVPNCARNTFLGTDLVHSLGTVLEDALPLIISQNDDLRECLPVHSESQEAEVQVGAKIISVVRAYGALIGGAEGHAPVSPVEAMRMLRNDSGTYAKDVVETLAALVKESGGLQDPEDVQALVATK